MKRAALALLVVPLVALWLYGCDKAENPLETQSQVSETALFAPGGGKVKPLPLPTGCTAPNLAAKYNEALGEWECANLQGTGAGSTTYSVYHRMGPTGWETSASPGVAVTTNTGGNDWWVDFPVDISDCAVVMNVDAGTQGVPYIRFSATRLEGLFGLVEFNLIAGCG